MDIEICTIDKSQARQMWAAGFPEDSDAFFDAFWELRGKDNTPLGLFDGGKLVSALHAIRQTVLIRGIPVPAVMISGVATRPEERHKGYAAMLMRDVHERIRHAGIPLAVLDPFLESFYEPFGYVTGTWFCDRTETEKGDPNGVHQMLDFGSLGAVYRKNMSKTSGPVLRTKQDWAFRISDLTLENGTVWGDNRANSYAMVIEEESCVNVFEYACEDGTERKLMQSLAAVFEKPIRYAVPVSGKETGARHGVMFCPLDIEALIRCIPAQNGYHCKFRVSDSEDTVEVSVCGEKVNTKKTFGEADISKEKMWQILLGASAKTDESELEEKLRLLWPPLQTMMWEQY